MVSLYFNVYIISITIFLNKYCQNRFNQLIFVLYFEVCSSYWTLYTSVSCLFKVQEIIFYFFISGRTPRSLPRDIFLNRLLLNELSEEVGSEDVTECDTCQVLFPSMNCKDGNSRRCLLTFFLLRGPTASFPRVYQQIIF